MKKTILILWLSMGFSFIHAQEDKVAVPEWMVFVEGGTFQMGSNSGESDEKPVHSVTLSSFYIGKYEVTVAGFREFVNATGYRTDAGNYGGGAYVLLPGPQWDNKSDANWKNPYFSQSEENPVTCVNWFDAVNYCNWRSQKEGLTPCYTINGYNVSCNFQAKGYRLPTEAEWEYAARGGKQSRGYTYSGSNTAGDVGWYGNNSRRKTHAGGKKLANELGIYDMTGNVWEWCWDWYGKNYYNSSPSADPRGPSSGEGCVLRGGSWSRDVNYLRIANRYRSSQTYRVSSRGFRLSRTY